MKGKDFSRFRTLKLLWAKVNCMAPPILSVLFPREFFQAKRFAHQVVELVSRTLNAIGYSGMGYATDKVKMVRIASEKSGKAFMPSVENVHLGVYPIARPLLMYTLGEPAGSVKKYLDWISQDGQGIVAAAGYVPLALGHDRTHRVTGEKGL